MRNFVALLLMTLSVALATAAQAQEEDARAQALQDQATAAFDAKDFAAARDALEALVPLKPGNPAVRYNLACALAQTGDASGAGAQLVEAIARGFVDLFHLARDPHLEPIHGTRDYEAILLGWRELLDARGAVNFEGAKRAFQKSGPYRFARDEALRINYVSAFDEVTFEEVREDLGRVAAWASAELFPEVGPDDGADPRPDPWATVILPTPEDFLRLVRSAHVGGFYDHDRRRLVSQDVGPSLRHEFLHILHWRSMTRLGQRHPDWIMEGLAAVVEDIDWDADRPAPLASWRTNIVKRLADMRRLTGLEELTSMDRARFVGRRPSAHYAEARAIMMFLDDQDALGAWYREYVRTYDDDPTGMDAIERVVGLTGAALERRYREWALALPEAIEELEEGMASLGSTISPGRGDGPRIQAIAPGGAARRGGLRLGDVITAIDGVSTRTADDLVRELASKRVGQTVRVDVRRGTLRVAAEVTLEPATARAEHPFGGRFR